MSNAALIQSITQAGQQRSQAILAAGQAKANSYMAIGNAFNQAVGTIVNARHQSRVLDLERQKLEQQDKESKRRMALEQAKFDHTKTMQDAAHKERLELLAKQKELTEWELARKKKYADEDRALDIESKKAVNNRYNAEAEAKRAALAKASQEYTRQEALAVAEQKMLIYNKTLNGAAGAERPFLTLQLVEDLEALGIPETALLGKQVLSALDDSTFMLPRTIDTDYINRLNNPQINAQLQDGIKAKIYTLGKADDKTGVQTYYYADAEGNPTLPVTMIGAISGQKFKEVIASADPLRISKMLSGIDIATQSKRPEGSVGIKDMYKYFKESGTSYTVDRAKASLKPNKDQRTSSLLDAFEARVQGMSAPLMTDDTGDAFDFTPEVPLEILRSDDPRAKSQFNATATANYIAGGESVDTGSSAAAQQYAKGVLGEAKQIEDPVQRTAARPAISLSGQLEPLLKKQKELQAMIDEYEKDLSSGVMPKKTKDEDPVFKLSGMNKTIAAVREAIDQIMDDPVKARKRVGKQAIAAAEPNLEYYGHAAEFEPEQFWPLKDQITYLTFVAYDELLEAFNSDNPGEAITALYQTTAVNRNKYSNRNKKQ